ncbi:MAG: sugar phosphate isomerase/epimerase [Clostridia bacterium]|nr:sugar phosphate isomerase/epimerase [Clostridia bacterium]
MIRFAAFADEASPSLEGQIAALHRNQISYIEVRALDGVNISKISEEQAKKYAERFAEENIRVWSIGSPLGKVKITCDFAEYREKVHHICRLAQIFGTDKVRIFSFFEAYDDEALVFAYLREMVQIAEEYGVCLYHENEKNIYGDTAERVLRLRENVSGLRFVYDPANYLEVGADIADALAQLYDKTDYFHIKDLVLSTGERVPAGYGDAMVGELIDRIGAKDCMMTIEPHLTVFAGFAEIDGGTLKSRFCYANSHEAFDAAAEGLKQLLLARGFVYDETQGGFEKQCKQD